MYRLPRLNYVSSGARAKHVCVPEGLALPMLVWVRHQFRKQNGLALSQECFELSSGDENVSLNRKDRLRGGAMDQLVGHHNGADRRQSAPQILPRFAPIGAAC